jgi:hypothetical protein
MEKDLLTRLHYYVKNQPDINAKLLAAIIYRTPCTITASEIELIHPFLLVELQHEPFTHIALAELKRELLTIDSTNNFQLIYLRDRLELFSAAERSSLLAHCASYFKTYESIKQPVSLDVAYAMLFFLTHLQDVSNAVHYVATIQILLPALMIHCAKAYELLTFSVLAEGCAHVKEHISATFITQTRSFIADLQTTKGSFGFHDPFLPETTNSDDTFIISAHLALAYTKLQAT